MALQQIRQANAKKKLAEEPFRRVTLSFYRYVKIADIENFRDYLYQEFDLLGVLGRIYVANEGINAQMSVPEHNFEAFKNSSMTMSLLQIWI